MEHKCINCGLLTIRNKDNQQLEEVKREVSGLIKDKQFELLQPKDIQPFCLLNQINLPFAYNELQMSTQITLDNETKISHVLKEKGCEHFTDYKQGSNPKEHREMIDREWMQRHLEEREDSQRASDKRWHLVEIIVIAIATIGAGVIGYFINQLIN